MNKKIVGFVLAMCLTLGLGVANVFGYSNSSSIEKVAAATQGGGQRIKVTTKESSSGSDALKGNLVSVFQYYGGSVLSCHGADGTYVLYDGFGQRGVIKATGEDGSWAVQSWNIRPTDYEAIKKAGSAKDYLLSVGFTPQSLRIMKTDENGQILGVNGKPLKQDDNGKFVDEDGNETDVAYIDIPDAFYEELLNAVSKVNGSATISLGSGATGPQLTTFIDGKPQTVWVSNGQGGIDWTTQYYYDDSGFQTGVLTKTFEIGESKDGFASVSNSYTYTKTTYDSDGVKHDVTYRIGTEAVKEFGGDAAVIKNPDGLINKSDVKTPGVKDNISSDENAGNVYKISETNYTRNNSVQSQVDYSQNVTIYFADNQQSYAIAINDNEDDKIKAGQIVQTWEYTNNGKLKAHFNAAGKDRNGETVGTTEIYDEYGRMRGVVNDQHIIGNDSKYKSALNTLNNAVKNGVGPGSYIMQVYFYAEDFLKPGAAKTSGGYIDYSRITENDLNKAVYERFGYTTYDVLNMMRFANGVSPIAQTTIADSEWGGDGKDIPDNIDYSSAKTNTKVKNKTNVESGSFDPKTSTKKTRKVKGVTFTNTIMLGGAQAYQTKVNKATQVDEDIENTITVDPVTEGEMWSSEPTDEELEAEMKKEGISKNDKKAVAALKAKLSKAKLNAMADRLGIDKNDEEAMEDLKNGFYTNSKGETVAIQVTSSINMLDGSGFKSTDGEIVMVVVDKDTKNRIIGNIKATGDRSVMFFGDVSKSENGFLTMTMVKDRSGGFAMGQEDIARMKQAIVNKDLDWVKENEELNTAMANAMFGHGTTNMKEVNLLWKTLEALSNVISGDFDAATKVLGSVATEDVGKFMNGLAAGINKTGYGNASTAILDWAKGMKMISKSSTRIDPVLVGVLEDNAPAIF